MPIDVDERSFKWPDSQKEVGLWDRYLVGIHDATIFSNEGFIQLPTGQFLNSTYWIKKQFFDQSFFERASSRIVKTRRGVWFSLLLYWGTGFYHWFCDVLPRLHLVLDQLPNETRFLIPHDPPTWMLESLDMIGIVSERRVEFDSRFPWRLEYLLYSPPVGMTGDIDSDAMNWLQDQFLANRDEGESPVRRIYVSREDARCRSVTNEQELMKALKQHGFEKVHAESLSFDAQVRTFQNAEFVIAPHGAGLTNLSWVANKSRVIEIFEPSTLRRCYWSLANGYGHEYRAYIGKTQASSSVEPNIEVDVKRIVGAL